MHDVFLWDVGARWLLATRPEFQGDGNWPAAKVWLTDGFLT